MDDPTPSVKDVALLTGYLNSLDVDDVSAWIVENDCIVEQAWLSSVQEKLERQWATTVMTAYAHARGELESIQLTVPESEDES